MPVFVPRRGSRTLVTSRHTRGGATAGHARPESHDIYCEYHAEHWGALAMRCSLLPTIFVCLASCAPAVADNGGKPFQVDADFPGGNAILDDVKGDEVFLHQDLRDTAG